ncbi:PREDICTED: 28S ribosomal protein S7, mitochondrial [Acromyrmex echinatior]|uniref:28S ribosomal protein S7, mitochondrial n=1 Tax=Acromyrmex echinatior TaxID=103372 RepID=UPI000580D3B8|nr:PREDICTED: 28S ribosomal protein S7, mitochondrial [Acromyrmex echinatior]
MLQTIAIRRMVNLCLFVTSSTKLLNNYGLARSINNFRYYFTSLKRGYSVFPSHYISPVYNKEEQEILFQSDEAKKIIHEQVKPALVSDTCSEFYDKRVLKFINTLMKNGNKKLVTTLVMKTFEGVKRIQLERYHKATTSEAKAEIELDPFVIFHRAVDNCTPILQLTCCSKGGITYQVPIPITPLKAQHKSMLWLIQAANEKESHLRFYDILAKELVAAFQNQGRAVKWKQELHKKCQANRAYAHFRWM